MYIRERLVVIIIILYMSSSPPSSSCKLVGCYYFFQQCGSGIINYWPISSSVTTRSIVSRKDREIDSAIGDVESWMVALRYSSNSSSSSSGSACANHQQENEEKGK